MRKKVLLSLVAASFLATNGLYAIGFNSLIPTVESNQTQQIPFAQNEAIVKLNLPKDLGFMQAVQMMQQVLGSFTHQDFTFINAMHIKVPSKSFDEIASLLKKLPFVERVEKNYAYKATKSNDPYYDKLWAIENTGQNINNTKGTVDDDMDVDEAWKSTKGSSDVVVAVLDTGVDYTHEDLADNMWNGNAHHGYDFAGDDNGNNDDDPMPDKPYDENGHYHGTHVAGIIGAVGDNAIGVTGVAQKVQIMALKVFRPSGYAYNSDILEALDYVSKKIDEGVKIVAINASYGGGGGSNGDTMDEAIKKLGEKGVVFCAAAGNEGKDIDKEPVYPASYDASNIITVAASDQNDKLTSFSNYGAKSVEVAAPGINILSTYPGNQYAYMQGTSMATPQVTGVVALLSSAKPDATVEERIDAIKNGVDLRDALQGKVSTSGRVNANNALKVLLDSDKPINTPPTAKDDSATTKYETAVVIDVLANDTDADNDALSIESVTNPANGSAVIENNKITYTPNKNFSGEDSFSYRVKDANGATATAKVTVNVQEKEKKEHRKHHKRGFFFRFFHFGWFK